MMYLIIINTPLGNTTLGSVTFTQVTQQIMSFCLLGEGSIHFNEKALYILIFLIIRNGKNQNEVYFSKTSRNKY